MLALLVFLSLMPNLVTATPIPFDDAVQAFTKTDSFSGSGLFEFWSNAGPYSSAGKLWRVCLNVVPLGGIDPANFLNVSSSADGGNTWIESDSAHRPQLSTVGIAESPLCDVCFGHDGIFYVLVRGSAGIAGRRLNVQRFDTGTGLWLAPFAGGPLVNSAGSVVNDPSIYQNSTNTDLLVLYDRTLVLNNAIIWVRVTGGVWGGENTLRASGFQNGPALAVIDSTDVARVFFQDANVSTYQAINPDDSLGVASATGWEGGTPVGSNFYLGKPVIWQSTLMLPATGAVGITGDQPFALLASPATAPTVFTATQVFNEPVPSDMVFTDTGMRYVIDGSNALWLAWGLLSHSPGGPGDPVTVSRIGMAQLCAPNLAWGNHQILWDQLTNPQTDQPNNDPDAQSFANFSLSYISGSDVFGAIVNIAGFNAQYAYYLRSTTAVASISVCGTPPPPPAPPPMVNIWNPGSSEMLLCDKHYPWIWAPAQRIPKSLRNSIPAPALNTETEIFAYLVPDGYYFVFDLVMNTYSGTNFIDGSGAILWIIDVNRPVGNPLPTGRPIAQFNSSEGSLERLVKTGTVQLKGNDVVRYKCEIFDPQVGVGLPNMIHAAISGWLYPMARV